MIVSLAIRDIVLIDRLQMEFEDGLCVLSGETGGRTTALLCGTLDWNMMAWEAARNRAVDSIVHRRTRTGSPLTKPRSRSREAIISIGARSSTWLTCPCEPRGKSESRWVALFMVDDMAGLGESFVRQGQIVSKDDPIGLMGGRQPGPQENLIETARDSGLFRGETLYMEVRQGRLPVDPAAILRLGQE